MGKYARRLHRFFVLEREDIVREQDSSEDKKDIAKADAADFLKIILNHYNKKNETMKEEKTEALVLRSFDYQEHERIITLFTEQMGLITLIVKGINKKNIHLFSLTTPFCLGEYIFTRGRSDLYKYVDGTYLDYLPLRQGLSHLRAGLAITKALLDSQLPGKPATKLYTLTLAYLRQIPLFEDPAILISSYHLKLLKHEGLTHLRTPCSHCAQESSHLHKGESLCYRHAGATGSFFFTKTEWEILIGLQDTRQFKDLQLLPVGPILQEKIENYFLNRIHQY